MNRQEAAKQIASILDQLENDSRKPVKQVTIAKSSISVGIVSTRRTFQSRVEITFCEVIEAQAIRSEDHVASNPQ